jgi:hypothetical protein
MEYFCCWPNMLRFFCCWLNILWFLTTRDIFNFSLKFHWIGNFIFYQLIDFFRIPLDIDLFGWLQVFCFKFSKVIAMHWQCKIFLHIYSIKSHYSVTLISLFLKYLNKYLHIIIWLDARVKYYYTDIVYKLNPK